MTCVCSLGICCIERKTTRPVVPKVWGAPPWGVEEILKGGARGAKLFYSLKINEKHKYY
jgi:hypothetical protein